MNKTKFNRFILCLVCVLAIAAMALCTNGCENEQETPQVGEISVGAVSTEDASKDESKTGVGETVRIGVGETKFDFEVIDGDGNISKFKVATDKKTVGEALLEVNLIEGEEGAYGLYVKKVNGIEADYDKDQTYWAFYIDDEMAMSGVDQTEIKAGSVYKFKVEK